jgi:hypothetical protein
VVSLQDYEDFARTFPGIAKARADVHPTRPESIFLTVAGPKGAAITQDSELAKRLGKALLRWGNPHLTIQVRSYRRVWFELAVRIELLPEAYGERVAGEVRTALAEAFSFERAVLGGRIWGSAVTTLIQGISGVVAVDIDQFARKLSGYYEQDMSHFESSYSMVQDQMTTVTTTTLRKGVCGNQTKFLQPRLRGKLPDSLSARSADPRTGLGAELLTLFPASLKLEVVDAL